MYFVWDPLALPICSQADCKKALPVVTGDSFSIIFGGESNFLMLTCMGKKRVNVRDKSIKKVLFFWVGNTVPSLL